MALNRSIFIVEDDVFVLEELKLIIEQCGYAVVGTSNSAVDATVAIQKLQPDLICLDIDLGTGGNGFDVAKNLTPNHKGRVLFITAFYDETTISQAKLYNPLGYIVKPFRDVDIKSNLSLAFHKLLSEQQKPETASDALFVRERSEVVRIAPSAIAYVRGEDNYSRLVYENGERTLTSATLKKMEEKLIPYGFVRVHKSYLVSLDKIRTLSGTTLYVGDKAIPIGKSYRHGLLEKITIL